MKLTSTKWLKESWPYLALLLVVVLPLLWMAARVAFSYHMFGIGGEPPTENTTELQVFMTFIAGGLATAATVFGALLTRQHNEREQKRLQLETVVKELEHLPAGKVRTAGSIATMVLLGEQSVAMRILEPAWSEESEVDDATATWLIGQVLSGSRRDEAAINEAATLLLDHARSLTISAKPGYFNFPGCLQEHWTPDLSSAAKEHLLLAMAETVLSQDLSWWPTKPPRWPAKVLLEALEDKDPGTRQSASVLLGAFLDSFPQQMRQRLTADQSQRLDLLRAQAQQSGLVPRAISAIAARVNEWALKAPPTVADTAQLPATHRHLLEGTHGPDRSP